jgi:iron(III) transport system substrate-binding protein
MIVILSVSCSNSDQNSGSDNTITLYNGQEEEIAEAVTKAFEQKTKIKVEIRNGEGAELANQLIEEGDNSPADVFWTENSPEITVVAEAKRLAKIDERTLGRVGARYRSPNGLWVGFAARETVLVYNPDQVSRSDLPSSVLNLADPVWDGRIGIAPAGSDFHPIVTAVVATKGKDMARTWLSGLRRNALSLRNNTAILRAVNDGHLAAGIINQHYWHRLRAAEGIDSVRARLHHFRNQDPGTLINVSGAGIVSATENAEAAKQFLAFLVDPAAQRLIVSSKDYEYPLVEGVAPDPQLEPLESLNPAPVGVEQLGDGTEAIDLLTEAGLL